MKISKKRLREIIKEEIDWSEEDKTYRGLRAQSFVTEDPGEIKFVLSKIVKLCNEALQSTEPWDGDDLAQEVLRIIEPYVGE